MSGRSTYLKLPYATPDDPLVAWPAASQALAETIDGSLVLPGSSRTADQLLMDYPIGPSVYPIAGSAVVAGGWPGTGPAEVLTIKSASDRASQFFFTHSTSNPIVRFRHGTTGGWSAWRDIVAPTMPRAVHVGQHTFPESGGQDMEQQITFPAGTFVTTPVIVTATNNRAYTIGSKAASPTGFILTRDGAGVSSSTGFWHAIETP